MEEGQGYCSTLNKLKKNRKFLDRNLSRSISIAFVVLPLVMSAFFHIWNPVGFPNIHTDEGHYIRRGIYTSEGHGVQEPSSNYDHPYFGWIFLGNIFSITGYPDSLNPKLGDVTSIEAIWSFPRIVIGLLSVADTFLIYKIAETRYNRKVAFIAAVLFAAMPYSWLTRRVLLESIQLPLILLSIFLAISCVPNVSKGWSRINNKNSNRNDIQNAGTNYSKCKNTLLISISGIFLGLAIFTKIPAFTFIPFVGFLIYAASSKKRGSNNDVKNNKISGIKNLAFWFVPVVLLPLLWPVYAVSVGQYEGWMEGINFQITRESRPLFDIMDNFYTMDPVLLILGITGVVYSVVVKREILFLIWIMPFLIFLYLIDYVASFFLIPLLPPLCIAPAVMLIDLSDRLIKNRKRTKQLLPFGIISAIAIFGFINTTAFVSESENSNYFGLAAAVTRQLPPDTSMQDGASPGQDEQVTVIGNPRFYWIIQYVFDRPQYSYKTQYNLINIHTVERIVEGSEKVIMIADEGILEIVKNDKEPDNPNAQRRAERLSEIYFSTELKTKIGRAEIRTNY